MKPPGIDVASCRAIKSRRTRRDRVIQRRGETFDEFDSDSEYSTFLLLNALYNHAAVVVSPELTLLFSKKTWDSSFIGANGDEVRPRKRERRRGEEKIRAYTRARAQAFIKREPAYRALIVPIYLACPPLPEPPAPVFPRPPDDGGDFRRDAERSRAHREIAPGQGSSGSRKCGPVRALESPCRTPGPSRPLPRRIPEAFPGRRPVSRRRDDRLNDEGNDEVSSSSFNAEDAAALLRAIALAPFSTQAQSSVDISPMRTPLDGALLFSPAPLFLLPSSSPAETRAPRSRHPVALSAFFQTGPRPPSARPVTATLPFLCL